jgi:predicted transposase YbfD/YdcC
VGQVFELERVRQTGAKVEVETVFGITSLRRAQADATALLALIRGHWGIENRLHYVKDETLGEDRCRVRTGSSPEVLSMLRNVAVQLLEEVEAPSKAAASRRFMIHPDKALPLLFG